MPYFDKTQKIANAHNIQLQYDYYTQPILPSDYTPNTPNHLELKFSPTSSTPNLTYPSQTTTYKTKYLYICDLIHNTILDVTCDSDSRPLGPDTFGGEIVGEMVIKHDKISGGGTGSLYTCFLLKFDNNQFSEANDIDNIINFKGKTGELPATLNLSIVQQENAFVYNSGADTIIVCTKPLHINNDSRQAIGKFSGTLYEPFKPYPLDNNYTTLSQESISRKATDDIYIDCQPTGESAETIATYNVPVNSAYTTNAAKMDLMAMTVQLCMVMGFLLLSYFLSPVIYKQVVINNVNKFVLENNDNNNKSKASDEAGFRDGNPDKTKIKGIDTFVRIASVDSWILVMTLVAFISLVTNGFKMDVDFQSIASALYVMIFFILSYATVTYNKTFADFMQTGINGASAGLKYPPDDARDGHEPNFWRLKDMLMFPLLCIRFIIGYSYNWISILFLFGLTATIMFLCYYFGALTDKLYIQNILTVVGIFIVITVPIISITNLKRGTFDFINFEDTSKISKLSRLRNMLPGAKIEVPT